MSYRCAVDVGAARTMIALIDEAQPTILAHERPDTDIVFPSWRPPGVALASAVQLFLSEQQVSVEDIVGIAVGIPGLVDRSAGTVLSCPNLPRLDSANLAQEASWELGVPVYIENNTNLIALGEHTAGLGVGIHDMAVIFVGSGVGCGLILDGKLYGGADGLASEFGHTIVVPHGLQCTCGAQGCVEMYCSGKALTRVAEELFGPKELYSLGTRFAGAGLLTERARADDTRARKALEESFIFMGVALTSLVNMLNPRLIVLGGGIIIGWPEGVNVAERIVRAQARPPFQRRLRIEVSQLQNSAGVLGGAALVSLKQAH